MLRDVSGEVGVVADLTGRWLRCATDETPNQRRRFYNSATAAYDIPASWTS